VVNGMRCAALDGRAGFQRALVNDYDVLDRDLPGETPSSALAEAVGRRMPHGLDPRGRSHGCRLA